MQSDNIYVIDLPEVRSSYIKRVELDDDTGYLTVFFRRWPHGTVVHTGASWNLFMQLCEAPSPGKFYLNHIKPNFKQLKRETMADRPKTINQASDEKRFIKMSINVQEIKKEWIFAGEKGAYLNITLQMLPDGKLDKFGNLGMITQDVPKSVYEKEKNLPKDQKTKGPILGNAAEFERFVAEGTPGSESGVMGDEGVVDDLPF